MQLGQCPRRDGQALDGRQALARVHAYKVDVALTQFRIGGRLP
jgi:hypothetical protein